MKLSAILEPLLTANVAPEVILQTVRAFEEEQESAIERSREKTRARVAKWRENHSGNVTQGDVTVTRVTNGSRAGVTRVEDKPLTQKIEPQEKVKKDTRSADADAFKAELADLDPERMKALIEHRRRKRAAITGRAAQMFRADAEKCGLSLADAVDTCIRRNWITVEPGWLAAPLARGSPPQGNEIALAAHRLTKEFQDARELRTRDSGGPARQALPNLSLVSGR